jgi:hypothetical protein
MSKRGNTQISRKEKIKQKKLIWLILSGFISLNLAYIFVALLLFLLQLVNPEYNTYFKYFGLNYNHGENFRFYSGKEPGAYAKIGRAITNDALSKRKMDGALVSIGLLEDKDTLENFASSGGYENFMKVTSEKNSFGLVQEAVLHLQDEQLLKSIKVIAPLFEERLHILYRKDLVPAGHNPNINLQLSANTETWILNSFFRSVKNVEVGEVGSGTRIIAGDIMDLIER